MLKSPSSIAKRFACLGVAVAISQLSSPATAHEFWIDPIEFTPKVGTTVPIVHRIGQNFLGDTYPFVRKLSRRFSIVDSKGERAIKTVDGDDPAAEVKFATPGLSIVVYQRVAELVTFKTYTQFEENLNIEGLEWVIDAHRKAGKRTADIRELYARCAKSLIAVGDGAGNDRAVGLPLEIIAEQNPYTLQASQPLGIRILHDGKPAVGLLVKSFNRDDPDSPRKARTDSDGRAQIELPKSGEVLISAVHMLQPNAKEQAEWSSLWASLTFKRP
jgi:Domain of unknown function (DUF4198)